MTVFISHNHRDKDIVRRMADDLRREGIKVWLNEDLIAPGEPWAEKLSNAVEQSDAVLVVMSRNTSESQWQTSEIAFAVAAQKRDVSKKVIPILIDKEAEVPFFLKNLLYCDLSNPDAYSRNFPQLVQAILRKPEGSLDAEQMQRLQLESIRAQRALLWEKQLELTSLKKTRMTSVLIALGSMVAASLTLLTFLFGSIQLGQRTVVFLIGAAAGISASIIVALITRVVHKKASRSEGVNGEQ
jgi:hypothetical protein